MKVITLGLTLLVLTTANVQATKFTDEIAKAAFEAQIPFQLLYAVCKVESNHNPKALNRDDGVGDSIGFCQIKVATAKLVDKTATREKLLNVDYNLKMSALYLRYQLDRYESDLRKAVCAYNAGSYREKSNGKAVNEIYYIKVKHQIFTIL